MAGVDLERLEEHAGTANESCNDVGDPLDSLELTDGRVLSYDSYGDPHGRPVLFNHGFSDSRLIRNPDGALTASLGVHVIVADQPGVGGSSPLKDRRMVDWGADMEQLVDALGVDGFTVAGHSGGGPHRWPSPTDCPIARRKSFLLRRYHHCPRRAWPRS